MKAAACQIASIMDDIARNIAEIRKNMDAACKHSGRSHNSVELVAVSKKQPADRLVAALTAGQCVFGENRVQEAQAHWKDLRKLYPHLKLHLIGPLQTNKAADAVKLFDVIETVDREKLVDALGDEMKRQKRQLPCFIQVNTGAEDQKSGVRIEGLEALYAYATKTGLNITGLMCIPPVDQNPAFHFGLLNSWARRLGLPHLSMGMSADYETAIRMGATHVRIGSALFGVRVEAK